MEKDGCEHINTIKIAELDKRLSMHIAYQKEAVDKAHYELRERLAGMNEFRDQLRDQAARFVTREEVAFQIDPIHKSINAIEMKLSNWEGRLIVISGFAALVGSAIGSVVMYLLK